MDLVEEKIVLNYGGIEKKYRSIWRTVDVRCTLQLHQPLHVVGYYLNSQLRYENKFSNVDEVRKGLFVCMDTMLDYKEHLIANIQLDLFGQARGEFGSCAVIDSR